MGVRESVAKIYRPLTARFRSNLTWALVLTLFLTLAGSVYSIIRLQSLSSDFSAMYEEEVSGENYLQSADILVLTISGEVKSYLLAGGSADRSIFLNGIERLSTRLTNVAGRAVATFHDDGKNEDLLAFRNEHRTYQASLAAVTDAIKAGGKIEAQALDRLWQAERQVTAVIRRLSVVKRKNNSAAFGAITLQLTASLIVTIVTLVGTFGYRIYRFRKKKNEAPCRDGETAAGK